MTAHSHVGASSMHRWGNCPGSVRLSQGIKGTASFAAAEGTVAHSLGERALRGEPWMDTLDTVLLTDDHDIIVTQEMLDAVALYAETVNMYRIPGDTMLVEHKFHLKDLHPGLFGTADCVIWSPSMKRLDVLDFKYGAGVAVEVDDNEQLKYYALGALLTCGFHATTVCIVIVQPRCPHPDGPVREYSFDAIDLLDFATDLVEAVKRTEAPDAPLKVGDWCRWCPAAGICPAQREHAQALAKIEFSAPAPVPPAPGSLTPVQLADVLEKAHVVEAWIKAVREHAYTLAVAGNPPPRHKLVEKVATRKIKPDASLHMLASVADCDVEMLYAEPKLLGVTDLEKLMPGKNAKERAAALAPFVTKESTGLCLVHESDKRPPADPNAAAKLVFKPE